MKVIVSKAQLGTFLILLLFLISPVLIFGQGSRSIQPTIYEEPGGPVTRFDSLFCERPNIIYIDFMEGFNDTVYVFRNNECVDTLGLITNESIGLAGGTVFGYNNNDSIYLTLKFKKTGLIIRDKLKLKYKHLQIRNIGSWGYHYSNHFPRLE